MIRTQTSSFWLKLTQRQVGDVTIAVVAILTVDAIITVTVTAIAIVMGTMILNQTATTPLNALNQMSAS